MSNRDRRTPCTFCGGEKPRGRRHASCGNCGTHTFMPVETQDLAIRLYQTENLSLEEVGARLAWSESAVRKVFVMRGIARKRPVGTHRQRAHALTRDDLDRTVELYMSGLTAAEVAAQIGRAQSTVTRRLQLAGVTPRPKAESHALAHIAKVARHGTGALTDRQVRAIEYLEANGPTVTARLAQYAGAPRSSMLRLMNSLAGLGLVSGTRGDVGHGHPVVWRRTELPIRDVLDRALEPHRGRPKDEELLPIGPFRDWLEQIIAREERKARFGAIAARGNDGEPNVHFIAAVARRLGISDRRLHVFRFEQNSISLATADKVLTYAGTGDSLEDLWPHLAHDDLELAA
jgi:AraC-like DNA-binding protein